MSKEKKRKAEPYKKKGVFGNLWGHRELYLMMLPGILYLLINNYLPIGGLSLAFKKYDYSKGILGSEWNGMSNFKFLFSTKDAALIIRNTLGYNFVFIVFGTIFAVAVAIILNEIRANVPKKIYQVFILIPYLVSMVVVSYIAFAFLSTDNGFINNSILHERVNWYMTPKYWPFILTIVHLWKGFGFQSIVFYATIIGFDKTYYEAAVVDGATIWQQITKITLPLLRPTVIMLTIMSLGRMFASDFGLFYQVPMNTGTLYTATTTIDTFVYRAMMEDHDVGRSLAAGFLQSILGFVVVMLTNTIVRKVDSDSALF